jgi:hypothetical protein
VFRPPDSNMKQRFPTHFLLFCFTAAIWMSFGAEIGGSQYPGPEPFPIEKEFATVTTPTFKQFCFDCHGEKKTKGQINLQQMTSAPDFTSLFKSWEKVIAMLEQKEMPPEEKAQPSAAERQKLITTTRKALDDFIAQRAGDPGRVAMRQLTSAEYAYTIQDLTGLDLGLERTFGDAVGGEGFANVGDVQFIQESILERYLEAAKIVASHAVVGAGPLKFFHHPGKTGQELSAIRRIQEIYQEHGFRTASGEGGNAFGLDLYPRAFHAAWRFKYRNELGMPGVTLAQFAHEEKIDFRFVEHIWNLFNAPSTSFPASEIVAAWRELPVPIGNRSSEGVRTQCENIYKLLQDWQLSLAENPGEAEVATVLTENSFKPSLTKSFRIQLAWPPGTSNATFDISTVPVLGKHASKPAIAWSQSTIRFRQPPAAGDVSSRHEPKPLNTIVSEATAQQLKFGRDLKGETIGTNVFVTSGVVALPVEFNIPHGMTRGELLMDARLDLSQGDDCVTRCVISHKLNEGATVAAIGTFSAILANPDGPEIESLKHGVNEFAHILPQISHREADPADRDPIPAPFDNSYNNAERNEFHAFIKYHRDDRFLTEHILDDATRAQLDQAWTDLLTSFDYYNLSLRFVGRKYHLDLGDRTIATIKADWIDALPEEPKRFVRQLAKDYGAAQGDLQAAEDGHVEDALRFAQLSWRRPLLDLEKERLLAYYRSRKESGLDHAEAIRSLLARILVAPAFLYRMESPNLTSTQVPETNSQNIRGRTYIALSDFELASRLSYFLWSSIPDAELSRAAVAGELQKPEQLAQQTERMLRDPKARRFATEFFGQWFGFYRFDNYRGVDTTRFPEFTDTLKSSLYDEAVSFFEHIVRRNRPVHEILFADYSFLNRDLAAHYNLDAATLSTNAVTQVNAVNQFHRGGLLRLGAVLTATSAPLRTSGVKRGDWILRRVLGKSIPPPPGDAGSIPPDDVLADGKTVRQRLESHRRDASCVNCHSQIDPLGFALEHFDSLGRWRDTYRDGKAIDASGTLNDGTQITELEGLTEYLRAHESLFTRTLCAKLLGYALGRAELLSDRPLLDQMTKSIQKDPRLSNLITQIVTSSQFRCQRDPRAKPAS